MTAYERGFADGERRCFDDHRAGRSLRIRPNEKLTPYGSGFWDGYTPRSLHWALNRVPARPFCEPVQAQEKETV